ncbi:MAG: sigma-70 family RNA polymerase sigma factor [Ruminococcus sp.]|nr:sigma-70 family RNA polymerase sigma factor [Ruminococcus sp.]
MDDNEMAAVYDKYKNTVYRTAFAWCRNTADAEDITQDVFMKRFSCDTHFADENHEKAWLLKTAANKCRDLFRSFRYKNTVSLEDANLIYETPEESAVYHAVMELPPKYRLVIHLYYYEEYSVKEIGGIIGKSETAVQTQLYRARKLLKNILGEELNL